MPGKQSKAVATLLTTPPLSGRRVVSEQLDEDDYDEEDDDEDDVDPFDDEDDYDEDEDD